MGNQMFQYAAARALSYRLGVPLGLDTSFINSRRLSFQLEKFNLKFEKVPNSKLPPQRDKNILSWYLWKLGLKEPRIFREKTLGYDPKILYLKDNTYLIGYWQSDKYFLDLEDTIRNDFKIKLPPTGLNLETYEEIIETPETISLHIRRGDYLIERNQKIHGVCSPKYNEIAIRKIGKLCSKTPTIFVFSDDPEWVSRNFKAPFQVRLMSHNSPENAIEDLRLMAACKHHIIANSSFSWWGAWLGKNNDKVVVAPAKWFSNPKFSNPDIYCKNWVKIKN